MIPHTHILTLLSLLVQTPTYATSNDICSALDKSLPPPILSVFHYPPNRRIVFLLKNSRIQSVPVGNFHFTKRTLSLRNTLPVKMVSNAELRCCSEPPTVHYEYMEIVPQECTDRLSIHYKIRIENFIVNKGARHPFFLSRDVYMEKPLELPKRLLTSVDHPNDDGPLAHSIVSVFCQPGRLCSLVTDPFTCSGYHFALIEGQKRVILQELTWMARIGHDAAKYSLQPFNGTHLEFALNSSRDDLFRGELPLGFILNQIVVLFSLRTSEVYLLHYVPLPVTVRRDDHRRLVPIIARISLAKFFDCPGAQFDNKLTIQLTVSLLILIILLTILISLFLVLLRAVRKRRLIHAKTVVVAGQLGNRVVPPKDKLAEVSAISGHYSLVEASLRRQNAGSRSETSSRSTANSSLSSMERDQRIKKVTKMLATSIQKRIGSNFNVVAEGKKTPKA